MERLEVPDELMYHDGVGWASPYYLFQLATATARQRAEALLEALSSSEPSPAPPPDA